MHRMLCKSTRVTKRKDDISIFGEFMALTLGNDSTSKKSRKRSYQQMVVASFRADTEGQGCWWWASQKESSYAWALRPALGRTEGWGLLC